MVSKATCAGPICEVLSLRRGLGPHHVRREHVGTWETSLRPQPSSTVQGRDGKPRRRSRQGSSEESDGVVVPVKRPNKAGMTSGGGRGGKDPARGEREWTVTDTGLSAGPCLTSAALAHGLAHWYRVVSRSRCTSGRSPVRENRTPGSARGAGSNSCPYRNSRDRNSIPGAEAVRLAESNTSMCDVPRLHQIVHRLPAPPIEVADAKVGTFGDLQGAVHLGRELTEPPQ